MKRTLHIPGLLRSRPLLLALVACMAASQTTEAAYWNRERNRNQRGHSEDNSHSSGGKSRSLDLDRDGIPNISDPDVDGDGIPNGDDPNVDGGTQPDGSYLGDRLPNNHPGEKDIDGDGLDDDSSAELDIDGDGKADDSPDELDIDGDGLPDDSPDELDIDGDGRNDDASNEYDIDGDGLVNALDDDIDGDGVANADDSDDDGDGVADADDSTPSGAVKSRGNSGAVAAPVGDGTAPATVQGLAYVISDSEGHFEDTLQFTSATGGAEVDSSGDNDPFTWTYTPGSTTAALRVQFKSDKWDEYDLDYATGRYVRREFDKNSLKDTDAGIFALEGAAPPAPPTGPGTSGGQVGDGTAPASPEALTFTIRENNGKLESWLVFTSATAGTENDPDGDVDPFTATWTTSGETATLRLQFKPDKWDEYALNFATGSYTRSEFKRNALDDTDTGFFALGAPDLTAGTGGPGAGAGNDDGTPDQGSGDN